jgi:hypothetical protein
LLRRMDDILAGGDKFGDDVVITGTSASRE